MKMPISIAIVENEATLAHALQLTLQNTDGLICTQVFGNGEDALVHLPQNPPDIALMDIDLGQGHMTGIECVAHLQTLCPNTQFMILTIFEDHQKVFDALSAGALGYVLKSSSPERLIAAIRDLSEGGAPMSPSIARKVALSFGKTSEIFPTPEANILTTREKEIIELIADGRMEKEVAAELFISLKTVKTHISNIYTKLQVRTRVEALNKYFGKRI
jgi:DNA-binding NarL/FixJ family response regulator